MEETFDKLYEHLEKLQQKNVVDYFENPKLVNDDQNAALESFIQKDWTSPFLTVDDDIHNLYIMFEYSDRDIYDILTNCDFVEHLQELVQLSGSMAKQTTLGTTARQINQLKELATSFYNNSDDLGFLANGLRKQYIDTLDKSQWSKFNAVCGKLQEMFNNFINEMDARPPESSSSSDGDYDDAQPFEDQHFTESFRQQSEARQKIDASQQKFNTTQKTPRSIFSFLRWRPWS